MIPGLNPEIEAHNEFLNWLTAVVVFVELAVERHEIYWHWECDKVVLFSIPVEELDDDITEAFV